MELVEATLNYFIFLPHQLQLLSIKGDNGINSPPLKSKRQYINVLMFSVSYTK